MKPVRVHVQDAQQRDPVPTRRLAAFATRAARRLKIGGSGRVLITFIDSRTMRTLNRRLLRHDRLTDVLSFRYDHEPTVGEILIAPVAARRYAAAHKVSYEDELARYVAHGLLHWLGHEDRTATQRQKMRHLEDDVLTTCWAQTTRHWSLITGH